MIEAMSNHCIMWNLLEGLLHRMFCKSFNGCDWIDLVDVKLDGLDEQWCAWLFRAAFCSKALTMLYRAPPSRFPWVLPSQEVRPPQGKGQEVPSR